MRCRVVRRQVAHCRADHCWEARCQELGRRQVERQREVGRSTRLGSRVLYIYRTREGVGRSACVESCKDCSEHPTWELGCHVA